MSVYNGDMSKRQILVIIGIWVMAILFLGFPSSWDKVLALVTGFIIICIAYSIRSEKRSASSSQVPYAEHRSVPASASEAVHSPIPPRTSADPYQQPAANDAGGTI